MDRFVLLILCGLLSVATAISMQSQETPTQTDPPNRMLGVFTPPSSLTLAASAPQTATLGSTPYTYRSFIKRTRIEDRQNVYPAADVVSFSYELDGEQAEPMRPVMFFFNGGPGSASIWLHMTGFGPEKVSADLDNATNDAVAITSDSNEGFLIDVADLVFVDPVGTGLSRVVEGEDETVFQDMRVDARAMCRFVQNWLEGEDRVGAPVYIVGVSYSTLRAAGMTSHSRCRDFRRNLSGLIFVSGLLDLRMRHINDAIGPASMFPTLAAIAWQRGDIDPSPWDGNLDQFLDDMETYADTVLTPAMATAHVQSEEAIRALINEMSAKVGQAPPPPRVSTVADAIRYARTRVGGRSAACGYDGRFNCGRSSASHPQISLSEFGGDLEDKLVDHVYTTMDYTLDPNAYYVLRGGRFRANWDYRFHKSSEAGGGTDMALTLARRLGSRRSIRVMVASGIYDLVTPYHAMEVALLRAGLSPSQFEMHRYSGGHMMYLQKETGYQLATDIRSFVSRAERGS